MRSLLVRCLVMLLALALANGNAHSDLHLASAEPEQTGHHEHHHAGGKASHHHQDRGSPCCCDCLGCTSAANLTPDLTVGRADLPIAVRYDVQSVFLAGRALLPEPDPPQTDHADLDPCGSRTGSREYLPAGPATPLPHSGLSISYRPTDIAAEASQGLRYL
jgi:hypothetical protein